MKPLPIEEQIIILRRVLWLPSINNGMCVKIARSACTLEYFTHPTEALGIIPAFTHISYLEFYSKVEAVQKRKNCSFWDSTTIFGNFRRRWFIRHLIKELKKQL